MEIPIVIFLGLQLIFLIAFFISSVVNIGHILRFGMSDRRNHVVLLLYVAFCVFVLLALGLYLAPIDWTQTFKVSLPVPSS